MIADIATGNTGTADVLFLIAVILFAIYALVALMGARVDGRIPPVLMGLGLACVSLGWLIL